MPDFECDEPKAHIDFSEHGLSFETARTIWLDPARRELSTFRVRDGEPRSKMLGTIKGKLHTAVFVRRGDKIRLISARRSNPSETKSYAREDDVRPRQSSADNA